MGTAVSPARSTSPARTPPPANDFAAEGLACPLCRDLLYEPVLQPCGQHSVCRGCLVGSLASEQGRQLGVSRGQARCAECQATGPYIYPKPGVFSRVLHSQLEQRYPDEFAQRRAEAVPASDAAPETEWSGGAPSQRDFASPPAPSPPPEPSPDEASAWPEESASPDAAAMPPPAPRGARGSPWLKRAAPDDETPAKPPSQAAPVTTEPPSPKRARTSPDLSASRHFLALGAGASQDLGAVVADGGARQRERCD